MLVQCRPCPLISVAVTSLQVMGMLVQCSPIRSCQDKVNLGTCTYSNKRVGKASPL